MNKVSVFERRYISDKTTGQQDYSQGFWMFGETVSVNFSMIHCYSIKITICACSVVTSLIAAHPARQMISNASCYKRHTALI